jgi:hypothetical protein
MNNAAMMMEIRFTMALDLENNSHHAQNERAHLTTAEHTEKWFSRVARKWS